jgi:fructosamine-3-kinase
MTELFGGFGPAFYSAYSDAWLLDAGYGARRNLYNLYHVLNHLNLFGASYLPQSEQLILRLLAEVR